MNKYEEGLAALDELFANTTAEEFERDYLSAEKNIGISAEEYLNCQNFSLFDAPSDDTRQSLSMDISWCSTNNHTSGLYKFYFSSFSVNSCSNVESEFTQRGLAA